MTPREDPRSIVLPVLKIAQPIGTFFVGSIKAKDLVDIADFDIRRLTKEEGIDSYLGIQRELIRSGCRKSVSMYAVPMLRSQHR